jgi:hypothetical protein
MMDKIARAKVVANFTFKNEMLGIGEFVERLETFSGVRVAVESSGNFWVKLYVALEEKVLGLFCLILRGLRLLLRLGLGRIGWTLQCLPTFYVLVLFLKAMFRLSVLGRLGLCFVIV